MLLQNSVYFFKIRIQILTGSSGVVVALNELLAANDWAPALIEKIEAVQ